MAAEYVLAAKAVAGAGTAAAGLIIAQVTEEPLATIGGTVAAVSILVGLAATIIRAFRADNGMATLVDDLRGEVRDLRTENRELRDALTGDDAQTIVSLLREIAEVKAELNRG